MNGNMMSRLLLLPRLKRWEMLHPFPEVLQALCPSKLKVDLAVQRDLADSTLAVWSPQRVPLVLQFDYRQIQLLHRVDHLATTVLRTLASHGCLKQVPRTFITRLRLRQSYTTELSIKSLLDAA